MKSITVHNLDEETISKIEKIAAEEGKSLNKTIKGLLHRALGISPNPTKQDEFAEFMGSWSEEEAENFNRNTAEFGKVNPLDWE